MLRISSNISLAMPALASPLHHLLLLRPPQPSPSLAVLPRRRRPPIRAVLSSPDPAKWGPAAAADVEMVRDADGGYSAKPKRVVVLWDLDNKPPRGPPYAAAMSLRRVARRFGDRVDISAYANRHAFVHVPGWVRDERGRRRRLDDLERRGLAAPAEPYACAVCGRRCRTHLDLRKHFRTLHQREREKKLARMRSIKGKAKRRKYKERFIAGNVKYEEAARELVVPKVGYGLAAELRKAGVFLKTVEDKPQAADSALKRQMQHSMSSGVDWLLLVSDDSDFAEMLQRAKESELGTVVIGDGRRALGRQADIWVPWVEVENGAVDEEMLRVGRRESEVEFVGAEFGDGEGEVVADVDSIVDEIVGGRGSSYGRIGASAFSDNEDSFWEEYDSEYASEEEEEDDDDDYL